MLSAADDSRWRDDKDRAFETVNRCLRAMKARGLPGSAADIARKLGLNDGSVRKILAGERPLRPEFLRDLGILAGLPVTDLFRAMKWLPEDEAGDAAAGLTGRLGVALELLGNALPHMERLTDPAPLAPSAAAQLVLGDRAGAERFDVRLTQILSGERYRAVTNAVAEFMPRTGATPLAYEAAEELAYAAGLSWRPTPEDLDRHPGHSSVALELRSRTHVLEQNGQEYSWQGGPGHLTWRSAAHVWPTHLLVQDPIGGRQRTVPEGASVGRDQRPIVVIGGRHGNGLAAALLAEALGRQFVLVRKNIDVTRHGYVRSVPPDAHRDRTGSWISVAHHIARMAESNTPWPTVVLVRPAVFEREGAGRRIHAYALRLLRTTSARIVYARPPAAYLSWWGARIEGDHQPGEYDGSAWAARTGVLYAEVEKVLAERVPGHDLLLRTPDPALPLPSHDPAVPAHVMDSTVRVAWAAIEWLARQDGELPHRLRAGDLRTWRHLLATDPDAAVPSLDDRI